MTIKEICDLLKKELYNNGYEYGFYLDGKKYKPDTTHGFDKEFFDLLHTVYRVQNPGETIREKTGTCIDEVVLMGFLLDDYNVPYKIWLLRNKAKDKMHTILTFEAEGKIVYLELTPQYNKPWYGKEIIYDREQDLFEEYRIKNYDISDVTDKIIIGAAPDFLDKE